MEENGGRNPYDREADRSQNDDAARDTGYSENYDPNGYNQNPYPNGQPYGYDPRQGYGYGQPQQPQYGYDPRAQGYGYDQQPRQPQYGYDPRAQGYGYDQPQGYGYADDGNGYAEAENAEQEDVEQPVYEGTEPFRSENYGERDFFDADEEEEEEDEGERIERRRKKSSFKKQLKEILRGIGRFISELPAKTLAVFGAVVAVLIVGVILLTVLLPKGNGKAPQDISDGQINLADATQLPTPTPSLAPTSEPVQEPEESLPEETPFIDPFAEGAIKTIGDTNDVIPSVQERLVELGYMTKPEGGYTTKFGTATKKAVRIFQVKNFEDSRDWDGILGSGTYAKLMSDDAKPFYLKRGDGDKETEELTDLVNAVKRLQDRLIELGYMSGTATSVYGSETVKAVTQFQTYNGLTADGVAGRSTLLLIYTDEALTAAQGAISPKPRPVEEAADAAAAGEAQENPAE